MSIKVAVIGAGPSGLLATKNMKEQGFDVTTFERRAYIGGLWKHSDEDIITVNPNTVFNSSRFRCAFTDFPFPDSVDDFPTCQQMFDYQQSYADYFGLRPHIRLNALIKDMRRASGKWELTIEGKNSETSVELFDKLMIATGSFQKPKRPDVPGIEGFAGDVRHAITFSPSEAYRNKKVLIIGFHASAVDVASSLSDITSKLYLSRKNGVVILPRYADDGRTFDQTLTLGLSFFQMFAERYFPKLWFWLLDTMLVKMSKQAFPEVIEKYGLLPAASIETTTPVIVDQLISQIESGKADFIGAVEKVTGPKTVQLKDGRVIENLDAIIFCTGYHFSIPFMPKEWDPYPIDGEPPKLYQNIYPLHPDPDVRNSLAFMGQGATPFPGFAMFESVSMATAQIWKGRSDLPPLSEMQKWYQENLNAYREKKGRMKTDSTFYPVMLPIDTWWPFLDRIAGTGIMEHFSWTSWKSWKFWWQERELYNVCKSGVLSPALFRLFETGRRQAWHGAKAQIFHDNKLAEERSKIRLAKVAQDKKRV